MADTSPSLAVTVVTGLIVAACTTTTVDRAAPAVGEDGGAADPEGGASDVASKDGGGGTDAASGLKTNGFPPKWIDGTSCATDPAIPPLGHDIALAVVGAILELVAIRIEDDRTRQLPELTDVLAEFVERHVVPSTPDSGARA